MGTGDRSFFTVPAAVQFNMFCNREPTALTCSRSWSFYWGTACMLLARIITRNTALQVRLQMSKYSSREVSIGDVLTAGMKPFKDAQLLWNASTSVSCGFVLHPGAVRWGLLLCSWAHAWVSIGWNPQWKRRAAWEPVDSCSAQSRPVHLRKNFYTSPSVFPIQLRRCAPSLASQWVWPQGGTQIMPGFCPLV